ncbi:hypothetical protein F5X99DRAFT_407195 [Biscogniauxia marginata]|nr:hypothetical protein F5X99DRAFT_407195 [Biscogniauxia marginata]
MSSAAAAAAMSDPEPTTTTTTDDPSSSSSSPSTVAAANNSPGPKTEGEEKEEKEEPKKLPPLSPAEFRGYNRLAEHMDMFHEHFRRTWTLLWEAASSGRRPAGMSLKGFLNEGLSFVSHLETHHSIEETYIFPVLARRMPEFQNSSSSPPGKGRGEGGGGGGAAELLRQHKEIHKGMEGLESYLRKCRTGETELEMSILKEKMESWGGVLWRHLDQEVKTLGAENMRKYWTIDEIRRIPM